MFILLEDVASTPSSHPPPLKKTKGKRKRKTKTKREKAFVAFWIKAWSIRRMGQLCKQSLPGVILQTWFMTKFRCTRDLVNHHFEIVFLKVFMRKTSRWPCHTRCNPRGYHTLCTWLGLHHFYLPCTHSRATMFYSNIPLCNRLSVILILARFSAKKVTGLANSPLYRLIFDFY